MSEFLRKHLLRLQSIMELMNSDIFITRREIKDIFRSLIADVEAHQKVITLKKPAPIDYQKVRCLAEQNNIPLHIKSDALDWKLILEAFHNRGIDVPTIPTIYENPHPTRVEEEAED